MTAKDFAALAKSVEEAPQNVIDVLTKFDKYDEWERNQGNPDNSGNTEAPPLPTEAELKTLYDWIDTLDVKLNAKITFTNIKDDASTAFDAINFTKVSDAANFALHIMYPKLGK